MKNCLIVMESPRFVSTTDLDFHTIGHENHNILPFHKMILYYQIRSNDTINLMTENHFVN